QVVGRVALDAERVVGGGPADVDQHHVAQAGRAQRPHRLRHVVQAHRGGGGADDQLAARGGHAGDVVGGGVLGLQQLHALAAPARPAHLHVELARAALRRQVLQPLRRRGDGEAGGDRRAPPLEEGDGGGGVAVDGDAAAVRVGRTVRGAERLQVERAFVPGAVERAGAPFGGCGQSGEHGGG